MVQAIIFSISYLLFYISYYQCLLHLYNMYNRLLRNLLYYRFFKFREFVTDDYKQNQTYNITVKANFKH